LEGTIKKVIYQRGFGFIRSPDSEGDIFFHSSNVKDGIFDQLEEGDEVSFEVEDGPKGRVAVKVEKVETEK